MALPCPDFKDSVSNSSLFKMKLAIFRTDCQTKKLLFLFLICQKVFFNQTGVLYFIKNFSLSTELNF